MDDGFPDGDEGKHAATNYKVLERFGYVALRGMQIGDGQNASDSRAYEIPRTYRFQ